MKKTIEIPDGDYSRLAAASSAAGLSLEAYLLAAAREKADRPPMNERVEQRTAGSSSSPTVSSLVDGLPEPNRQALLDVQADIDAEFSKIEPEEWN